MTVAAEGSPGRLRLLRGVFNDALYRGSLILLVNTVLTSAIGFAFWTLAAHRYPAAAVGVFASVTSGVGLLATVASLGLSNTVTRHIAGAENPRELVAVALTAITTVGTILCLATLLVLGPRLPPALHLQQHGRMVILATVLVVFTAVSTTIDAGLVAIRSTHAVLIKNLVGSVAKVAALLLLTSLRSSGLLISYCLGLVLATLLGGVALSRRTSGKGARISSFRTLPRYLSVSSGNYIATTMGILPSSVVPFEVLIVRGAAETARFAIAFLIATFLNLIPSTVAQVFFAETSRRGVPLGGQLRKAIRGIYGLLVPAIIVTMAAAPLILRLFGGSYVTASSCLRILALSSLFMGGTYLIDSLLIARDRIGAYVFMNGANAALVVACVGLLLRYGLAGAAAGWGLAQALSLLLGLLVLVTGTAGGRHHPRFRHEQPRKMPQFPWHPLEAEEPAPEAEGAA
jgi:O-antigen/teichoic acid export membrane protein